MLYLLRFVAESSTRRCGRVTVPSRRQICEMVEDRHAGAGTAGHHSFVDGIMRSSACMCNLGR